MTNLRNKIRTLIIKIGNLYYVPRYYWIDVPRNRKH